MRPRSSRTASRARLGRRLSFQVSGVVRTSGGRSTCRRGRTHMPEPVTIREVQVTFDPPLSTVN
jgi:hypothetical protein